MNYHLILLIGLIISACGDKKESVQSSQFVNKPESSECIPSQQGKQFIVVWKDGSMSREYAEDREDFINHFLQENKHFIDFAEYDYVVHTPVAKDSLFQLTKFDNWGVANIGAPSVWREGARGRNLVVAVIDSGLDVFHEQMQNQIFINDSEIPDNGIDDDSNGYVDDHYGYNFVSANGDVATDSVHGTHVSGIIAAEHHDDLLQTDKVQGVAPESQILPLKFIDSHGGGFVSHAIEAIDYAINRGAKIINASWGGGCSESLRLKMQNLNERNVLFIAAAGTSSQNIDIQPEYPAAYSIDAMISVGAITKFNGLAFFSNYGNSRVHLFAPGESIVSTVPTNSYEIFDGTSMAAPFVSGAAAVLWGDQPEASAQDVKQALLESVVIETDSFGLPVYHNSTRGRLNLEQALHLLRQRQSNDTK